MALILALDQGTTSSRSLLFDASGHIVGVAQQEFEQIFPRPGWVEHDANVIWQTQLQTARDALAQAGATPGDVAGIGITNQRETTVLWDRATGEPVANAIVWQDRRTAEVCDRLVADGHAETIQRKTGLVVDAYFSGTKVAWLLDHVPGARARAEAGELAFGTIDCWLAARLTGGARHVTDPSNASRTLLFDIHAGDWDDALLELLGVPRAVLPEVVPSCGVAGEVAGLGDLDGLPVAGLVGDQQGALMGQLCTTPGLAKCTYGTGCFLLVNTGGEPIASRNKLLSTVAWRQGRDPLQYALEGSVFIGGAVVQWLRDGLGLIPTAPDVEALAQQVPDTGGVVLVPAFAGLGAPHWDPYARGTICGITRGTTAAHLARAALEAIAFQVADLVDACQADLSTPIRELRVDGGASANDTLMQFQADVLGLPIVRPAVTETTGQGAAFLAGLATGVWSGVDDLQSRVSVDRRFEPAGDAGALAAARERWNEAVARSRGWERSQESPRSQERPGSQEARG